jgi:dihydroorotase
MIFDTILANGRVIDPSQSIDEITDVAFSNGRVAKIGKHLPRDQAAKTHDVSGHIVTPGLIDLHTHVYADATSISIDAEHFARLSAVTTAVDTGSAGPGNFAGFRKHIIERSAVRILAYLHVSHAGIYAFSKRVMVGESEEIRMMDPIGAVEVAMANPEHIIGIKIRVGAHASGASGIAPLDIALQVAEETGLPLMAHIDDPPPSYEDVLARLRPGDILTHCFRPFPNTPIGPQGRLKPAVAEARDRGVIFDIGHGKASFSFRTARAMLANNFPPDTISSDVHVLCIDGPAFDLVTTLSKFINLGMPLNEVIRAATQTPARALRRHDLGTLKPGSPGDASILSLDHGEYDFVDATNDHLTGDRRLHAKGVVIAGHLWHGAF